MAIEFSATQWQLAGTRPDVETPLGTWGAYLPILRDGDELIAPDPQGESMSTVSVDMRPGPGMLERFVALDDEASIVAYGERWGLLGLCAKHGIGHHHPANATGPICRSPALREPLMMWRTFSRLAGEVINTTWALQRDEIPDVSFFRTIQGYEQLLADPVDPETLQRLVAYLVSTVFIDDGGARIAISWDERPTFVISPGSLLGAIGVQLAFSMAASEGLAMCTSCGKPYTPKRRPRAGQRNYCPDCGRSASNRDSARRRRGAPTTRDQETR